MLKEIAMERSKIIAAMAARIAVAGPLVTVNGPVESGKKKTARVPMTSTTASRRER